MTFPSQENHLLIFKNFHDTWEQCKILCTVFYQNITCALICFQILFDPALVRTGSYYNIIKKNIFQNILTQALIEPGITSGRQRYFCELWYINN